MEMDGLLKVVDDNPRNDTLDLAFDVVAFFQETPVMTIPTDVPGTAGIIFT